MSFIPISILSNDWIDRFRDCGCDAFLVWPSNISTTFKQTFDFRLKILEQDLGMIKLAADSCVDPENIFSDIEIKAKILSKFYKGLRTGPGWSRPDRCRVLRYAKSQ